MGEPFPTYPKLYAEIPKAYHDPLARLEALDADGVDAEVLFPNPPGGTFFESGDVEFELDAVRAYNDALAEWRRASDRYVPLGDRAVLELAGGDQARVRARRRNGPSRRQPDGADA